MLMHVTCAHHKANIVMRSNSGGKCKRFSEEHPTWGDFT